jgi:hypothetical protein
MPSVFLNYPVVPGFLIDRLLGTLCVLILHIFLPLPIRAFLMSSLIFLTILLPWKRTLLFVLFHLSRKFMIQFLVLVLRRLRGRMGLLGFFIINIGPLLSRWFSVVSGIFLISIIFSGSLIILSLFLFPSKLVLPWSIDQFVQSHLQDHL